MLCFGKSYHWEVTSATTVLGVILGLAAVTNPYWFEIFSGELEVADKGVILVSQNPLDSKSGSEGSGPTDLSWKHLRGF